MKKEFVLRTKKDFSRLKSKGKSIGGRYSVFVYLPNNLGINRKAFLATKKLGNSVERHRAVRLMRESMRLIEKEHDVPQGMDFLFIARSSILDSNCADVKKNIEAAMRKAGLI